VAKRTRGKRQQNARGSQKPGKLTAAQLRAIVHKQDAALGRAPRQVLDKLPGVDAPRATADRVAPDLPRLPGAGDAADDDAEMVIQVETQHEDTSAVRTPPRVTIVSRRQRKVIGEQG
jgi:hypothetical protein